MGFVPMIILCLIFGIYEDSRLNPLTSEQISKIHQEQQQNCKQGKYENTLERIQKCNR